MCSRGPAQKMLSDLTYNELKNYDVLKSVLANQVIQRRKETYLRHRCQILWNWRKIFSNSNREIEHHSIQTYNLPKSKQNILLYYIQRALSRKCFCQTLQAFFYGNNFLIRTGHASPIGLRNLKKIQKVCQLDGLQIQKHVTMNQFKEKH